MLAVGANGNFILGEMLLYGGCCSGGWGGIAVEVVVEVVEGMAAMVGCGGLWCRAANAAYTSTSIGREEN